MRELTPCETGEFDPLDLNEGGDGIVYASSPSEAATIRAEILQRGMLLYNPEGGPTE